jgi:hypothetical protein
MKHHEFIESIRKIEQEQRSSGIDYSEQHVRQSVVHTREDVIGIYRILSSIEDSFNKSNIYNCITMIGIIIIVIRDFI